MKKHTKDHLKKLITPLINKIPSDIARDLKITQNRAMYLVNEIKFERFVGAQHTYDRLHAKAVRRAV